MRFFLALTFFLTILAPSVYASVDDDQSQIIRFQQQFEQENSRAKEASQLILEREKFDQQKQLEDGLDGLESQEGKVVQNLLAIQCFRINRVVFSPNRILPKEKEKDFTEKYLGKCLTLETIAKISRKVTNYFIEEGYETSYAQVPAQDLMSGTLFVKINESFLEKITLNGDKNLSDKTQKFFAFGSEESQQIFNVRKIEQGLKQMNRLPSNNAKMKIISGSSPRNSIVVVENQPKNRSRINFAIDNNGNKKTGELRETIGFTQNNLFWLNDNLTISRTANSLDKNRKEAANNALSGNFSIPFSWHILTLSASKNSFSFWAQDGGEQVKSWGETVNKSVILDSVLLRTKKIKLASSLSFLNRDNENFKGDVKQQTTSRKASIASASFLQTFFSDKSTLFFKESYNRTLNVLDSQKDPANLDRSSPHAEFELLKFYSSYSRKMDLAQTPLSYSLIFDSQISKTRLNNIDSFSVGGFYSVRGFKNSSIAGDSGYSLRNELSANLGKIILPYLGDEKISESAKYLNLFSLTPFYDFGSVRKADGSQSGKLSGAGLKIGFKRGNLNSSLTFSHSLSKSRMLTQARNENSVIYFNASYELGFF